VQLEDLVCQRGERTLTIQAAPEEIGYPVFLHPGTPGSRHLYLPQVERAARAGIRLVSWDRPGYGQSPGRPGRQVAEAAKEAALVADFLKLEHFGTWGFSGGGPFALSCGAVLPDRVSAVVAIASLAPYQAPGLDWVGSFSDEARREVELFFADPVAHRELHSENARAIGGSLGRAEAWLEHWGEQALTDEAHSRALAEHLALGVREALFSGDEGWYEDDAAFLTPWGFELGEIKVPVQLWHGVDDSNVPVAHGEFLAREIPNIEAHFLEGKDHSNTDAAAEQIAWEWLRETARKR
jgi:pimeloyl-ACP methyl ester carboxylesterase